MSNLNQANGDNQAVADNQAVVQRGGGAAAARGRWRGRGGCRQRRRKSFLDDLLYISRGVVTMVLNAFLFVCDKFTPIVLPILVYIHKGFCSIMKAIEEGNEEEKGDEEEGK